MIFASAQVCDADLPRLTIAPHPNNPLGIGCIISDGSGRNRIILGWAILEAMLAAKPKAETAAVVAGFQGSETDSAAGNDQFAKGGGA